MVRLVHVSGYSDRSHLADPGIIYLFSQKQANRGFTRSRLCTNKDGNTNNLVLYTVRNGTSKKGGNTPRATD